jgi:hypothetical protein
MPEISHLSILANLANCIVKRQKSEIIVWVIVADDKIEKFNGELRSLAPKSAGPLVLALAG